MTYSIFPIIQPDAEAAPETELPLCREIGWDFDNDRPLFSAGEPVEVTGADAVRVWCWKALRTARSRYEIYTPDYGCDMDALVGQAYTDDVKRSEAARCVREALEVNPYVTDVREVSAEFTDSVLHISCAVSTVYGEVDVNV